MMRDRPSSPTGVPSRAVLAAAALILIWQLILPPVVGVANNGDFIKLLGRYGLGTTDVFQHANTRYTFNDSYRWESGYQSSELLVIVPALAINRVLSKDGSFDIRIMGVLHGGLFLLALFLFVPLLDGTRRWAAAGVCVLALALFGDFLYVGYLNTFYVDVPAYLFLLVRHPVYAAWITLGFPGLALLDRSWPMLLTPWIAYAIFRRLIHRVDEYLEQRFGQAYRDYRRRVNEVIAIPRFWQGE
jgi:protein-S-isoprenylcysteine O-methyltransferase Ste14